jgi:hypothetical protein
MWNALGRKGCIGGSEVKNQKEESFIGNLDKYEGIMSN